MTDKPTPRLYKGRRNINVPLQSVFKTVKSIVAAGKEDDFLSQHGRKSMVANPALVNAVKTHLAAHANLASDPHANAVVTSQAPPAGQPPTCFPERSPG